MKTKRFELTEEERKLCNVVAISFGIDKAGCFYVREEWGGIIWSDGITVTIPPRIWAAGLAWLAGEPA